MCTRVIIKFIWKDATLHATFRLSDCASISSVECLSTLMEGSFPIFSHHLVLLKRVPRNYAESIKSVFIFLT